MKRANNFLNVLRNESQKETRTIKFIIKNTFEDTL